MGVKQAVSNSALAHCGCDDRSSGLVSRCVYLTLKCSVVNIYIYAFFSFTKAVLSSDVENIHIRLFFFFLSVNSTMVHCGHLMHFVAQSQGYFQTRWPAAPRS